MIYYVGCDVFRFLILDGQNYSFAECLSSHDETISMVIPDAKIDDIRRIVAKIYDGQISESELNDPDLMAIISTLQIEFLDYSKAQELEQQQISKSFKKVVKKFIH